MAIPAARLDRAPGSRPIALALLLSAVGLAAAPALASSPEAWNRYDRQVRAACVAASRLAAVRVRGTRIDFPSLSLSSLLLEGTYPQPHMRGQQGLELCIYEQRSGRAAVAEANGLQAPASPQQPSPAILPMPGAAMPGKAVPAGSPAMPR